MTDLRTRYRPVADGYEIVGSREVFNRTLYGSHANDDLPARYFTFAGDLPVFMGAVTDWSRHTACHYAKSGVLMSGLALTPGATVPAFYAEDIDLSSRWFHHADDVIAVFRNGWMEYELHHGSPWFPTVDVWITALPLLPEDGFLVHYRIKTDQRVIFCAGFGGMTDILGRFEYREAGIRNFHASDCAGNVVQRGENRARVTGGHGDAMWIGASFPVGVDIVDAALLEGGPPSLFLGGEPGVGSRQAVRFSTPVDAGGVLEGHIVAVRGSDERVLEEWMNRSDAVESLKERIRGKHAIVSVQTPDAMLDLTVPPTVLAMDASWHKNTFCHGAHGYHSPFLGWRNWYGPTAIGWHDRVQTAIESHCAEIVKSAPGEERVWYDGKDRPDLDHEGTQYHHIENSTGYIPCFLGGNDIYNMQEVAVDMLLHHLQWTGDLELARRLFDDIAGVLDWEERILDPDQDGLYQNFLNTWISDGHSYNGGGCAQASAYNYVANLAMARIAGRIGRSPEPFQARADKILDAVQTKLWLRDKGVVAEYIDTIGNKLVHPSPELSTIYLAIDCGLVDPFQAYRMLRFTETDLRNERTLNRNGRLVYSSNWLPKKYSTCGLFPAENMHLALACFQLGLKDKGMEILDAIADSYFSGDNPGLARHVLTGHGAPDMGDLDFSDVSSMHLRLLVEGLFGIRFRLLQGAIEIAPGFPADWTHARIALKDIALDYRRDDNEETVTIQCASPARKVFRLPLRSAQVECVRLNGTVTEYSIEARVNGCALVVETSLTGRLELHVAHGARPAPSIAAMPSSVFEGDAVTLEVSDGELVEWRDEAGAFADVSLCGRALSAKAAGAPGRHTLFVRVQAGHYDAWLAVDVAIERACPAPTIAVPSCSGTGRFEPLDISSCFNASLTDLHSREYLSPRPEGYSIGVRANGRYAWEWNHGGHNAVVVDDSRLREGGGIFGSPSGIPFATPSSGPNLACASLWDNFPTTLRIPIGRKARELAVFFIGVTHAMQCYVENVRFTLTYDSGAEEALGLIHPVSFDDWLVPALQTANETVYFSEYNHGIVQRLRLNPDEALAALCVEAVANEVIIGVLGVSASVES